MRCFNAALRGERQLVFLSGPPGIGKTTLVNTFLEQVMATRLRLLSPTPNTQHPIPFFNTQHSTPSPWIGHGQCIEHYGAGEAYLPLLEALSRLGREPEGEAVVAVLTQYAPTWLAQLPSLVSDQERGALHRTLIGATRERMLREIAEALEELSLQRPLVLVLEDLHWSDLSTLEMLAYVTRRRGSARLFILGTYRPVEVRASGNPLRGIVQELQGRGHCTELRLGLLNEAQVTHYLAARLAGGAQHATPLHRLAQVIHQRTEGNPLFMVTVVEQMVREGVIEETAGQWHIRADLASLKTEVPDTLRQLIEKQFDTLRREEQRVLEIASVAGTEFEAAAVAAVAAQPVEVVDKQCIGLATRGQFIREQGMAEWPNGTLGGRYRFLHVLYQNILYERVAKARRIVLHRRIGDRKEAAYGDTSREIAAELAVHFEAGRDYQRAIKYLTRAGENALQRSAHAEPCQRTEQIEESMMALSEGLSSAAKHEEHLYEAELYRLKGELTLQKCQVLSVKCQVPNLQRSTFDSQHSTLSTQRSAVFRYDGTCWTITFDGVMCRLDDTLGMRYLAALLWRPHQAVHVRELAGEPLQSDSVAPTGDEASLRPMAHDRKTPVPPSERTRVNVTRAINTAIKKLTRVHHALGDYLTATIKTGTTCSYSPPNSPSITWQV